MKEQLLEKLRPITEEERKILEEHKEIQKDIYTATEEFKIDSRKMLEKGRVIDIRTHTRFTAFPRHSLISLKSCICVKGIHFIKSME